MLLHGERIGRSCPSRSGRMATIIASAARYQADARDESRSPADRRRKRLVPGELRELEEMALRNRRAGVSTRSAAGEGASWLQFRGAFGEALPPCLLRSRTARSSVTQGLHRSTIGGGIRAAYVDFAEAILARCSASCSRAGPGSIVIRVAEAQNCRTVGLSNDFRSDDNGVLKICVRRCLPRVQLRPRARSSSTRRAIRVRRFADERPAPRANEIDRK